MRMFISTPKNINFTVAVVVFSNFFMQATLAAPMMKSLGKKVSQTFNFNNKALMKQITQFDQGSWGGVVENWHLLQDHSVHIAKLLLNPKNKIVPAEILKQHTEGNYERNVYKTLSEITTDKKDFRSLVLASCRRPSVFVMTAMVQAADDFLPNVNSHNDGIKQQIMDNLIKIFSEAEHDVKTCRGEVYRSIRLPPHLIDTTLPRIQRGSDGKFLSPASSSPTSSSSPAVENGARSPLHVVNHITEADEHIREHSPQLVSTHPPHHTGEDLISFDK